MVMQLHEHPCPADGCGSKVYSTMGPNATRRMDWIFCDAHHPDAELMIVPFDNGSR